MSNQATRLSGRNRLRQAVIGSACIVLAGAAWASELRERDQAMLEQAHDRHTAAVEQAEASYRQALERANEALRDRYTRVIERYEEQGDQDAASRLEAELDRRLVSLPDDGGDGEPGEAAAPAEAREAPPALADEPGIDAHADLIESIGPNLVEFPAGRVRSDTLAEFPYIMVYFSASWCGPCQRFNPELKSFYEENVDTGLFEVVLVSRDRSEQDMLSYIRDVEMPWVAVPYNRIDRSGLQAEYGGRGIPNLVLIDHEGEVVSASYVDGDYVGPRQVLRDMQEVVDYYHEHNTLPDHGS